MIDDPFGVDVIAVTDGKAIQASDFTNDTSRPQLQSWIFDTDSGQFILTFSETVDIKTLQVSEISILNGPSGDVYPLTGSSALMPSDALNIFAIQLLEDDLNYIKSQDNLGITTSDSYLTISEDAIIDMAGNHVVFIPSNNPLQAETLIDDTTKPILRTFSLDMNIGTLNLTFSETIEASTFNVSSIRLVNRASGFTSYHNPSSSYSSTEDSPIVVVTLIDDNLNAIKAISDLASSASNTYLIFETTIAQDKTGNHAVPIPSNSAQAVTGYTTDRTSPLLDFFILNMTSGELIFTFIETVCASSFNPTKMTLKNAPSNTVTIM